MVDVGRRESTAGGGDRGGVVNVKGLALVTTISTTVLHVRGVQGIRDGYPPVVRELSGACETDLLEHGNKGGKGNRRRGRWCWGRRTRDAERRDAAPAVVLKYGDGTGGM